MNKELRAVADNIIDAAIKAVLPDEAGNDADSTKLINEVIDKLARKIEKAYDL